MSDLLAAMTLVLLAWCGLAVLFVGLGLLVRRAFTRTASADALTSAFWVGWAMALLLLQVWHLWFRIDWRAWLVIGSLGVAGVLPFRLRWWRRLGRGVRRQPLLSCVLLLVAVWLANRAIGPPANVDSGLYHFTAVRWAVEYAIVPGLGNLHYRIAFNSTDFLYVALLDAGWWTGRSQHVANGLLLAVLLLTSLRSAASAVRGRWKVETPFDLFLLPVIVREALGPNVASPSPDLPAFALSVVIARQLLTLVLGTASSAREPRYRMFSIVMLAATGITVKLSVGALGVSAAVVAIAMSMARRQPRRWPEMRRLLIGVNACAALILIHWMIRGVILSGYVAYPSTVGSLPVDWRIPRSYVAEAAADVRAWATSADPHSGPPAKVPFDLTLPLVLATAASSLTLRRHMNERPDSNTDAVRWLVLMPPILSILFWGATAPAARFLAGAPWVLAGAAAALAVQDLHRRFGALVDRAVMRLCVAASLALTMSALIDGKGSAVRTLIAGRDIVQSARHLGFYPNTHPIAAGPDGGFHPAPRREVDPFVTRSGLIIYVPRDGNQCWAAPLPCARRPVPDLRLRKDGSMARGFSCLEGPDRRPPLAPCGL